MHTIPRILVAIVTILFLRMQPIFGQKCNDNERDEYIENIVGPISNTSYNFPRNNVEITQFCNKHQKSNKFLKEYSNRCLRNEAKTIISVFAYSNSRGIKKLCSKNGSNKPRAEMIQFSSCANSNKLAMHKCFRQMLNRLNVTSSITDATKRMPYICCCNFYLKECLLDLLERSPACTEKTIQLFRNYYESVSENVINAVCDGSEENSDRCTKLMNLPKAPVVNTKYRSPFPIVISVFENL